MSVNRRQILQALGASASLFAMPSLVRANAAAAHVVVVGGGFGGATAARYLRKYNQDLKITLVEPNETFVTCPFSNLHLGGLRDLGSISHSYAALASEGINLVKATANEINATAKTIRTSDDVTLSYDKLVVSPGIDFRWGALEGYDEAASELVPHAWKAGAQTELLKRQLEAMDDGGTFVMSITDGAFRCPPGPYERASMIAHYFKTHKPKSKILLLDSKDQFSKKGLFTAGWKELYGDMIEWVSLSDDGKVASVNAETREVTTAFGEVHKADVLNIVPPQKAGWIAERAGMTNETGWVPVKGNSFESAQLADVYVVGDATIAAPMPKSGFCANAQGKVAASAITAALSGREVPPASFANTCYSLIGPDYGISVAGVYKTDGDKIVEVEGAGGVSPAEASAEFRKAEAVYGEGWYQAITQDIWGTSA